MTTDLAVNKSQAWLYEQSLKQNINFQATDLLKFQAFDLLFSFNLGSAVTLMRDEWFIHW